MLIKFTEIYEENVSQNKKFFTRQVFINKSHIVCIKEDLLALDNYIRNQISNIFDDNVKFTLITLNKGNMGQDITVIGSPEHIYKIVESANGKA